MSRIAQEIGPRGALLWLPLRSAWVENGRSVCKNWGRAPGYPRTVQRGDGVTPTTYPTLITGRRGMSFDGGDYIDTGIVDRFTHATPFSFACRGESLTNTFRPLLADFDSAATKGFRFYYHQDLGRLVFDWYKDGGNYIYVYASNIVTQQAHTYSMTYDGSGVFGGVKLYQDGNPLTLSNSSAGTANANASGKTLLVGANHNGAAKAQPIIGRMIGAVLHPFCATPTQVSILSNQLISEARLD